ncbi:tRNA1(Val) (adenine(37)-N6)-methyltransferase [Tepidamorphus sp. 3E244]|uniref:tRNA1(Val) (adenine(37)-N6)-methyltransferase n=1 Tax=Tepidamorphus sp. 3E244 TaxID=3385498 RepID=UPI0038FC96C1
MSGFEGETTDDAFLGGALTLTQPRRGHRSGLDAVLLAASAPVAPGETVLDLGSGAGAAGLCVLARVEAASAVFLDRDAAMLDLAARNASANGFSERVTTVCFDLDSPGGVEAAGLRQGSIDHVIANPPFFQDGQTRATPDENRRAAHLAGASLEASLERWASFAAGALRKGGSVTFVHRADALPAILSAFEGRFGNVAVTPIHPRPGLPAIRVLVRGLKGSKAPLNLAPAITLHGAEGETFLPQVEAVLRRPAAL